MLRAVKWEEKYFPLPVLEQAARIAASAPDELTPESLIGGALSGFYHLWLAYDEDEIVMVLFVELRPYYATRKILARISGIAGDGIREALQLVPEIETWAKNAGASKIVIVGRRGWEALLRDHGYGLDAITLSKSLENGDV